MADFNYDIEQCIKVLASGGLFLYPTDTIWGIGCDATNSKAIQKLYNLKKRPETKSLIILAKEEMVKEYTEDDTEKVSAFLETTIKPTTFIYQKPKNLPLNLISEEQTVAIRIPKEEFCLQLLTNFNKPIVSTSPNLSGAATPYNFNEISSAIKSGVDYIVQHRQNDIMSRQPSTIVSLDENGCIKIIRP